MLFKINWAERFVDNFAFQEAEGNLEIERQQNQNFWKGWKIFSLC